ncbi:MAG: arsenate reductase (glutaredoxin) [Legionella sp. 40-6]|nr:arsenate reductase (glutaredoxin) [Legionella sp.]OJX90985.1 MAG: arsenate reductase (glutaredoxin) [Legionella sp. 40-6]
MQQPTVYHNPQCSKSNLVIELIQRQGYQPKIIDYIKSPPTPEVLESFFAQIDLKDLVRTNDPLFNELNLSLTDKKSLLQALHTHPQLLQRPIVVYKNKIIVARPPARVLELLHVFNA